MPLDDEDEIARLYNVDFEHRGCAYLRERDNAELIGQRDAALAQRDAALAGDLTVQRSFEQWRVTGQPTVGGPPVDHTWIPATTDPDDPDDPRGKAQRFVAQHRATGQPWAQGPHLHRRVVLYTGWQPADPEPGPAGPLEDR